MSFPRLTPRSRRLVTALIPAIVALLVCILYASNNHFPDHMTVLPLDDSYIHLQYAWQASQGHFLQYNTGDLPTSGATSLLYMLLIASGFILGINHSAMPFVLLVAGAGFFTLTTVIIADAARRAAELIALPQGATGLLAGLLFAGSGWMAWAYLSGMETGMLMLFVSGALWALLYERPIFAGVFTSLAALTRPEAGLLGLAILAAILIIRSVDGSRWKRNLIFAVLPLLAMLVSPAVNWLLTGNASASGFTAKSWFTNEPVYLDLVARQIGAAFLHLSLNLFGGSTPNNRLYSVPLLQLMVVLGIIASLHQPKVKRAMLAAVLWSVGLVLATATLQTVIWQNYRYQMPAYPTLIVVAAVGVMWIVTRVVRYPVGSIAMLMLAVAWGTYSIPDFGRIYNNDISSVERMQIPMANWLRVNTPTTARIAVHDVGVTRYLGERYTIDTIGLTTPGSAKAFRNGPGALYEFFREARPDYYAVYPSVAPPYYGISDAPSLLGTPIYTVTAPAYPPIINPMEIQVISKPDWSMADLAASPQQVNIVEWVASLTLRDMLNVADLLDEESHGYIWWESNRNPGFISDARFVPYRYNHNIKLADGGRLLSGGESFTLATNPASPMLLIGRFHQMNNTVLRVLANGELVGEWPLPAIPGEWFESAFLIPARYIQSSSTRITCEVVNGAINGAFSPFYYWAYQGDIQQPVASPTTLINANLGNVAHLAGIDLPSTTFSAGGTLSLKLYLSALQPTRDDWRIFVHLINPGDDSAKGIITQWDMAPHVGTYPFWVWPTDEIVSEDVQLVLPAQTPAGEYLLLMGIYNSATGERTPISGATDYGNNRFLLAHITIK